MKGESQKRDLTLSWNVVKLKGRSLQLGTPRPSKITQNLWQKFGCWLLEMTLHQAISHLIQETAAKFKGTFCDWSWSQTHKYADSEFWRSWKGWENLSEVDAHPRKQTQGLPRTASDGVAQEAGNGWLAARLMHSKAVSTAEVTDIMTICLPAPSKNDHTSFRYFWHTRIKRK